MLLPSQEVQQGGGLCLHADFNSSRGLRKHIDNKHPWYYYFDEQPEVKGEDMSILEPTSKKVCTSKRTRYVFAFVNYTFKRGRKEVNCLCWSLCPHTSHHYLLSTLLCDIRRVIHPIEQCNISQMIAEECINAIEHCNRTINTTDSVSRQ